MCECMSVLEDELNLVLFLKPCFTNYTFASVRFAVCATATPTDLDPRIGQEKNPFNRKKKWKKPQEEQHGAGNIHHVPNKVDVLHVKDNQKDIMKRRRMEQPPGGANRQD